MNIWVLVKIINILLVFREEVFILIYEIKDLMLLENVFIYILYMICVVLDVIL